MRKVIAAINMTIDGFCDHTAISPGEDVHHHYSELLQGAGAALYGRITYQLMQYWQTILENPTGNKDIDEFAAAIDAVPKVVFSRTLHDTGWKTARLADRDLKEEILVLKEQQGKDIFVCSPGLIVSCMNLNLIDEYQLCVHPVVVGRGLPLFKNVSDRHTLELVKTKTFGSGAMILYYVPAEKSM